MATITIRKVDEKVKAKLRVRAASHGHSMEEEARTILRDAVNSDPSQSSTESLAETIRRRFAPFGGVELKIPRRDAIRPAPKFDK
jgi:plasmid stability protein